MSIINKKDPLKFGSTEWKDVFMIQKSYNPDNGATVFVGRLSIPPIYVDRVINTTLLNKNPGIENQLRESIEREMKRFLKEMSK